MNPRIVAFIAFFLLVWWWVASSRNDFSDVASATGTPGADGKPFIFRDYTITPLEPFKLEGRVLSRKRYNSGREAELSHLDLAMGWGPMADPDILSYFEISQRNRWYFWRAQQLPISKRDVIAHSANMHMIPSSKAIFEALNKARENHMIELQGYLVRAEAADGWKWQSSLSRTDTGNGSCEVIYVTSFNILE